MKARDRKILGVGSLDELQLQLNGAQHDLTNADGSDLRYQQLLDRIGSSLPVFGREPRCTLGIYSWDDTRLMHPSPFGWILAPRDDL